ncbi:MAG: hypothetical protein ACI4ET_12745 [Bilifractor sp.]
MPRFERNHKMFFASFDGEKWAPLGKDNDDLSKDLNPDVDTSKNVLGETTVDFAGYEPSVEVDPYYAEEGDVLYSKLADIAEQELSGDEDVAGFYAEVMFDKVDKTAGTMTGTGHKRAAKIIPSSIGGDTTGVGIPFTVYPYGPMETVTVTYTKATRAVTIAAATPSGASG